MNHCRGGITLVGAMEEELFEKQVISESPTQWTLLQLEAAILHVAAVPNLCRGVLYSFPVLLKDRKVIIRCVSMCI